jgi:hypothetical protein
MWIVETLLVAGLVLGASAYLARYVRRMYRGSAGGCGCGASGGCPKGGAAGR